MSDLRTGLVEAMARGLHGEVHPATPGTISCSRCVVGARLALDRGLGFLTANAEAWDEAAWQLKGESNLNTDHFIAVLSDSRDTGEKPDE